MDAREKRVEVKEVIQVSEIAAMAILETLQASGVGPDKGLRLKQEDIGLSLRIDAPKDNDNVTWHNKSVILIVDRDTEKNIGDALVDVDESSEEARLVLRHKMLSKYHQPTPR
jgi:hypothetical protein